MPPPPFDLSTECLSKLYESQNGKGYYSHIPLKLRPLSDWQASLERLNPKSDYVSDNIVFEALEFNNTCQWSKGKVLEIPRLIHESGSLGLEDLQIARVKPSIKRIQRPLDDHNCCYGCHQSLSTDNFYAAHPKICKSCHNLRTQRFKNTLRGYMIFLLGSARGTSLRKRSTKDDNRGECTISLDELFNILEGQKFRCYYSGIPMQFTTNSDWRCSLERLDNMEGYTKENCVLICYEFNSADRTALAKFKVYGSAQWSREKFVYFYKTRFEEEPPSVLGWTI